MRVTAWKRSKGEGADGVGRVSGHDAVLTVSASSTARSGTKVAQ